MRKLLAVILWVLSTELCAQSEQTLTLAAFYEQVKISHPMAQQARLILSRGEFAKRQARGAFDPKLIAKYNTKQFEDKDYYDLWDSYVKIPTILNIDFKAGYEKNSGTFLNPQNSLPSDGLYYAGVSVPLGQGLIHNPRTIERRRGDVTNRTIQNDAANVFNNLMLDANHTYWLWYEAYQKLLMTQNNLGLIEVRFNGIRESVLNGENAAMDSVETLIQLQQWSNNYQKAQLDYQNSQLMLNNFLWQESSDSIEYLPNGQPDAFSASIDVYLDFAQSNHPKLQDIRLKQEGLELDRKLSAEMIKPVLNVNYNFLTARNGSDDDYNYTLANDYKGGFEFAFPLFIRKERAKLKQVKIKLQENNFKLDQQSRTVLNKVIQAYNKVLTLQELILQQQAMVINYETLLNGERIRFDNGESSVFLVNSRENKKIDAQMKLIDLQADYGRAIGLLEWASARFSEDLVQ